MTVAGVEEKPKAQSNTGKAILVIAALFLLANVLWFGWRFLGPVEVRIESTLVDLPFTVETIPSVVNARAGETVKVLYRIRNNAMTPVNAFGTLEIEPASASAQVKVYVTQCSGLNAYQANFPQEYEVVFRVLEPAGFGGAQQVTIRHTFKRAGSP